MRLCDIGIPDGRTHAQTKRRIPAIIAKKISTIVISLGEVEPEVSGGISQALAARGSLARRSGTTDMVGRHIERRSSV